MKKLIYTLALTCAITQANAQNASVISPDQNLKVDMTLENGKPFYQVSYKNCVVLEKSPLGFTANNGDYSTNLSWAGSKTSKQSKTYEQDRIKRYKNTFEANALDVTLKNNSGKTFTVTFLVADNDIAFRYSMEKQGETGAIIVNREATGFNFPVSTTTFLTPQSDAMIGWKRTKPSYEEWYRLEAPVTSRSEYGHGFTFPCLFHVGQCWALVSETGVDGRYCASRLGDADDEGTLLIEYPMKEENNGVGSATPAVALPMVTPWRTLTIGDNLKPIVETTIPWDVVEPHDTPTKQYQMGKGTWSWILWQDGSINYDDQIKYIDLAHSMGYEFVLIDNWWDKNIGKKRIEQLVKYAKSKNVGVQLWYSSSGYWNDIEQSPLNMMNDPFARKREMKWMKEIGVKGIKVDFFGGDKQETMQLYESILSDANEYGLTVIFHGTTIPRGWERMYPNYVGSEAVLASENLIFEQRFCDAEAWCACLHPFVRNTIGSMEYGGTFLNKRLNRNNDGGTTRVTSDAFQIATAVLFQNPIQNFALAPNNLSDAPALALEFMKNVPTTWEDICFIDGYPGKYVVLARKSGDKWYIAGANAEQKEKKLTISLPMAVKGTKADYFHDGKDGQLEKSSIVVKDNTKVKVTIKPNGGFVIVI